MEDVDELDDLKELNENPKEMARQLSIKMNELRLSRHDPEKSMDGIDRMLASLLLDFDDKPHKEQIAILKEVKEYHKMQHGSKERDMRVDSKNLNVNVLSEDARKVIAERTTFEIKDDEKN